MIRSGRIISAAALLLVAGFSEFAFAQSAAEFLETRGVPPMYRGVPLYRSGGRVFPAGLYLHDYLRRHEDLSIGDLDLEELLWSLQVGVARGLVNAGNISSTGDQILAALRRRGGGGQNTLEFSEGLAPAGQRISVVAARLNNLFDGSARAEDIRARLALRTITAPELGITNRGLPELWASVPRAFGRFGFLADDSQAVRRNLLLHYPFGETLLEMRAPEIFWSRGVQGRGVKVGILDSNFFLDDEEIKEAVVRASSAAYIAGGDDHGNLMARAVHAFAPQAGLYLYDAQAMFNEHSTPEQVNEAMRAALEQAADDRVDILLMSFAGPLRVSMFAEIVPALARLAANGTLLLTANGNEPADDQEYFSSAAPFPNIFPFALSVGALEPSGRPARIGTRGPILFGLPADEEPSLYYKPDLVAPHTLFVCGNDNTTCGTTQGSSFANAVTAGVSALLLSQARGGSLAMSGSDLAPILKDTALAIPGVYVADQGHGHLNPAGASRRIDEMRVRRLLDLAIPDSARGLWQRPPSPRLLLPLIDRL